MPPELRMAILLQAAPMAPLSFNLTIQAINPSVRGWQMNPLGFQRSQDLWLESPPAPGGP